MGFFKKKDAQKDLDDIEQEIGQRAPSKQNGEELEL